MWALPQDGVVLLGPGAGGLQVKQDGLWIDHCGTHAVDASRAPYIIPSASVCVLSFSQQNISGRLLLVLIYTYH